MEVVRVEGQGTGATKREKIEVFGARVLVTFEEDLAISIAEDLRSANVALVRRMRLLRKRIDWEIDRCLSF
jgi:hypothetical protein